MHSYSETSVAMARGTTVSLCQGIPYSKGCEPNRAMNRNRGFINDGRSKYQARTAHHGPVSTLTNLPLPRKQRRVSRLLQICTSASREDKSLPLILSGFTAPGNRSKLSDTLASAVRCTERMINEHCTFAPLLTGDSRNFN